MENTLDKSLKPLIGSEARVKVLLFLREHKEGYVTQMAHALNLPLNAVQSQLRNLGKGKVVISWKDGKRKVFSFNPRYPLIRELLALLKKASA